MGEYDALLFGVLQEFCKERGLILDESGFAYLQIPVRRHAHAIPEAHGVSMLLLKDASEREEPALTAPFPIA